MRCRFRRGFNHHISLFNIFLAVMIIALAGCNDSRIKSAQSLAKCGSDTYQSLADYYSTLAKQQEDMMVINVYVDASGGDSGSSYLLNETRFTDFDGFVKVITSQRDKLSRQILDSLSFDLRQRLYAHPGSQDSKLKADLINELNTLVLPDETLYEPSRFAGMNTNFDAAMQCYKAAQKQVINITTKLSASTNKQERMKYQQELEKAWKCRDAAMEDAERVTALQGLIKDCLDTRSVCQANLIAIPDYRTKHLNNLLISGAYMKYLTPCLDEESAMIVQAMEYRKNVALAMKSVYDAVQKLADYDASGEVNTAVNGLIKQLGEVEDKPVTITVSGHTVPNEYFAGMLGTLARLKQEKELNKRINELTSLNVLFSGMFIEPTPKDGVKDQAASDKINYELPLYVMIADDYYNSVRVLTADLLAEHKDREPAYYIYTPSYIRFISEVGILPEQPIIRSDNDRNTALAEVDSKAVNLMLEARQTANKHCDGLKKLINMHNAFTGKQP